MSLYTVHVPRRAPDAVTRAERTIFLREGFGLAAFVFGVFYLLWHRLWAAATVWVVLVLALAAFAVVIQPPSAALLVLAGLMHLYLGVEGRDLLRWGLARRGYALHDLVSAADLATAEAVFFSRQPEPTASLPAPAVGMRAAGLPAVASVIGVFPEREGA